MIQNAFQRYEKKYILSASQYRELNVLLREHTVPDEHGSYSISNIYYDTDDFRLIRESIEKPLYKEKLRMRCYGKASEDTKVFVELKMKFDGIVYKRRAALSYADAKKLIATGECTDTSCQIQREICRFLQKYELSEKVFLYSERKALSGTDGSGIRITFDSNLRFREEELRLDNGSWGTALLSPGQTLMEIKIPGAFPMWLSRYLSELGIFPASFSKYGSCYKNFILKEQLEKRSVFSA